MATPNLAVPFVLNIRGNGGAECKLNFRVVRKKVPLGQWLNGSWMSDIPMDRVIPTLKQQTDHIAAVKPERQLGAPWIANLVATRRQFCLCDNCYRKYIKGESWWKHHEYLPLWHPRSLTDCDGCSEFLLCVKFVPGEAPPAMARINFREGAKLYAG